MASPLRGGAFLLGNSLIIVTVSTAALRPTPGERMGTPAPPCSLSRGTERSHSMKNFAKLVVGAAFLAVAACGEGKGDDKAAADVENAFDAQAQQLEKAAENASGEAEEQLEDQAEIYERTGEAAADAIDDVDLNAQAAPAAGGKQR
ncbi:MAG: hypothetical protein M3Q08_13250 [Pseudomonadota bacterium]|nr:hypothetical protein [Pseudomonadota bacterium]